MFDPHQKSNRFALLAVAFLRVSVELVVSGAVRAE